MSPLRERAVIAGISLVLSASWVGCSAPDNAPAPGAAAGSGVVSPVGGSAGSGAIAAGSGAKAPAAGGGGVVHVPGGIAGTQSGSTTGTIIPPAAGAGGTAVSPSAGSGGVAAGGGGRRGAAGRNGESGEAGSGAPSTPTTGGAPKLPPADGGLDYQLGGAYTPAADVKIVSRDRTESPAKGLYNICYINGFQAQQSENDFWMSDHPDLILQSGGRAVVDQDWDELLLDTSTPEKRQALAAVEAEWIAGCADAGFDAIEVDNLDSYSRSGGALSEDNAVAFMKLLAASAHEHGLAIAQKNSTELVGRKKDMGTDFVVAEECNRYDECGDYMAGYGSNVLIIEYRRADFEKGCEAFPNLSIVLRDVELVPEGQGGYVYEGC